MCLIQKCLLATGSNDQTISIVINSQLNLSCR